MDSNIFLAAIKKGILVIDAGVSLANLKATVCGQRVLAVLLTHGHYDHTFYTDDYSTEFGCPIYVHENAKQTLYDTNFNYGNGWTVSSSKSRFEFLSGNGVLSVDETEVIYFETPGHSACSMSFLAEGELFVGDLVFKNGVGRCDLITSSKPHMLESLKLIDSIAFKTLHSGHGEDSSFETQKRNLMAFIRFMERKN